MLWKRAPVVPLKPENQDFLGELARQTGEERDRVQTLLEEYARQRDRTPAPARRWSITSKASAGDPQLPSVQPQPDTTNLQTQKIQSQPEKIEELSTRLQRVESDMAALVDGLSKLVATLQQRQR